MQNDKCVKISVVIPVYQNKDGLVDTVTSMLSQDFPNDQYKIIIADNNSRDSTKQVATEFQKAYPERIKVVHQDQVQGPSAARNAGIKAASGEICCFIDADMTADPDYLSRVFRHFTDDDELMYFGCNVKILQTATTLSDNIDRKYSFNMRGLFERKHYVGTGCLSVKRCIFDKIGLFDERFITGEDTEFGERVYAAGLKQYYDHDLVLYHPSQSTYASVINRSIRHARGHAQLYYFYPERYKEYKSKHYYKMSWYLPKKVIISAVEYFYYLPIRLLSLKAFHCELRRLNNQEKGA